MKKITYSIIFSLLCLFGFSQTFPGTGTPADTQGPGGGTAATCNTSNELNLTVAVTGIGILGTTNILDQVDIDITHTWAGDINVTLIAPDGTTQAVMTAGNGGSGDDYTGTQFRDDAATAISAGSPPFTGPFQPEEALATFNGVDADGTWTLNFCDSANGDTGTFNSWSITFAPAPSCLDPSGVTATPTSLSEATVSWTPGGSEPQWTYEYGVSPYAQGGTPLGSGTVSSPTVDLTGLVAGTTYDFYVQANCGGGDGDSGYATVQWTHPAEGDACSLPIMATVETDCSTATPVSLDFDAGGVEFLPTCDAAGNNGYWVEATAPASGSININLGGTATGVGVAIFDACGGTEVFCANNNLGSVTELAGFTPSATYYFYFWQDTASGVAEVCFEEVSCVFPTNLGVTVLAGETSADLSWDAEATASAGYNWAVMNVGEDPTADTPVDSGSTTGTTATATGLTPGNDYDFYVQSDCGATQSVFAGPVSFSAVLPPANDDCANATVVSAPSTTAFNTTAASDDNGGFCGTTPGAPNVWFAYTATADGTLLVSLCNDADYDSKVNVYDGGCGTLDCVGGNDDGSGCGVTSEVTITVTSGTTYLISVNGYLGATGTGNLTLDFTLSNGPELNNPGAFSYYPNPVKNTLSLNASTNNIEDVTMFNMLGQQVMQVQPNALTSDVDMSGLQTGTYFVKVTVASVTKTIRIVKQ